MVLKSPSATTSMFFSIARCQGGDFQDHGSEGVQTMERPLFDENASQLCDFGALLVAQIACCNRDVRCDSNRTPPNH